MIKKLWDAIRRTDEKATRAEMMTEDPMMMVHNPFVDMMIRETVNREISYLNFDERINGIINNQLFQTVNTGERYRCSTHYIKIEGLGGYGKIQKSDLVFMQRGQSWEGAGILFHLELLTKGERVLSAKVTKYWNKNELNDSWHIDDWEFNLKMTSNKWLLVDLQNSYFSTESDFLVFFIWGITTSKLTIIDRSSVNESDIREINFNYPLSKQEKVIL